MFLNCFLWYHVRMIGYVTCEKPELKVREFEIYSGYYCGVCKSLGAEYGQIPRMLLSYDAAFLAMVMAGTADTESEISMEHCITHHIKKKTVIRNDSIDYAADVMMILAWHNLKDDVEDEGKISSRLLMTLLRGKYRILEKKYPELCSSVEEEIEKLSFIEREKSPSLDMASEAFARIMRIVFTGDGKNRDDKSKSGLAMLGYHLGKWIYLMDAWEDLEENIESGAYNPLIYRHKLNSEESVADFRERIRENVEFNLLMNLSQVGEAVENIDIKDNSGIIDNVVYMGLLRRTEKALGKEGVVNGEKSI